MNEAEDDEQEQREAGARSGQTFLTRKGEDRRTLGNLLGSVLVLVQRGKEREGKHTCMMQHKKKSHSAVIFERLPAPHMSKSPPLNTLHK